MAALEALQQRMAASPYPHVAGDEATLRWFLQGKPAAASRSCCSYGWVPLSLWQLHWWQAVGARPGVPLASSDATRLLYQMCVTELVCAVSSIAFQIASLTWMKLRGS